MAGDRSVLIYYQEVGLENITFVDNVKGLVLGKRTLNVEGFPKLDNVLHVEDLKDNFHSISQICDRDLFVNFDKKKCRVLDIDRNCIMEGYRSSNHYYKLISPIIFHKTTLDDTIMASKVWSFELQVTN